MRYSHECLLSRPELPHVPLIADEYVSIEHIDPVLFPELRPYREKSDGTYMVLGRITYRQLLLGEGSIHSSPVTTVPCAVFNEASLFRFVFTDALDLARLSADYREDQAELYRFKQAIWAVLAQGACAATRLLTRNGFSIATDRMSVDEYFRCIQKYPNYDPAYTDYKVWLVPALDAPFLEDQLSITEDGMVRLLMYELEEWILWKIQQQTIHGRTNAHITGHIPVSITRAPSRKRSNEPMLDIEDLDLAMPPCMALLAPNRRFPKDSGRVTMMKILNGANMAFEPIDRWFKSRHRMDPGGARSAQARFDYIAFHRKGYSSRPRCEDMTCPLQHDTQACMNLFAQRNPDLPPPRSHLTGPRDWFIWRETRK
jgi:hypothetical protein